MSKRPRKRVWNLTSEQFRHILRRYGLVQLEPGVRLVIDGKETHYSFKDALDELE